MWTVFMISSFFGTQQLATGGEPNTLLLAQANHETDPGAELSH